MFVCRAKNTGSTLNLLLHYPRERQRERKKLSVCLLPLSSKSVLIKLYRPRTHMHTERGLSKYSGLSSHSVSVWTAASLCLSVSAAILLPSSFSPRAPSHRSRRVTGCVFQPMFEHQAINAGQRERAGARGGEGQHNWLLTENSKSERLEATA